MRTITKTITKTAIIDTTVISDLSKIVDVLHNMCVLPRWKVINLYGTEWKRTQKLLKELLYSFYKFENGTTQVDLIDLQTGEPYNEFYTITRSALFEAARDGIIAVPCIEL